MHLVLGEIKEKEAGACLCHKRTKRNSKRFGKDARGERHPKGTTGMALVVVRLVGVWELPGAQWTRGFGGKL